MLEEVEIPNSSLRLLCNTPDSQEVGWEDFLYSEYRGQWRSMEVDWRGWYQTEAEIKADWNFWQQPNKQKKHIIFCNYDSYYINISPSPWKPFHKMSVYFYTFTENIIMYNITLYKYLDNDNIVSPS